MSWRRTRHRLWRTAAVLVVVETPLIILIMLLLVLGRHLGGHYFLWPVAAPVSAPLDVAGVVIGAAALSWLFRRYDVVDGTGLIPAAT